jgi:hypothetical protein
MQSESARHSTQCPANTSQTGSAALQSVFVAHSEHCELSVLHTGWLGGHVIAVMQPTQAPVVVSQVGASPGQVALLLQAGWHCASPGKQLCPTAQSAAVRQATHAPETQKGWFIGQSVLVAQSPHPTPGKQPFVHGTPLTEHAAAPVPLLHAATSMLAPATANAPRKSAFALAREIQRSEDEGGAPSEEWVVTASLQESQDVL